MDSAPPQQQQENPPAAAPPPGIYVPVPTFFSPPPPNTSRALLPLDLPTQTSHALHLARAGISGLILLGSTGEAIHLTNRERTSLIAAVRAATTAAGYPSWPLIAGTATQGVADTLAQLHDARDAGAQWGLVLAPGYFAPVATQAGLREWYVAVADASPLPILIYHYPGVSNNLALAPQTIVELSRHPNIVGAKLSHGNLAHHCLVASAPGLGDGFAVFTGLGQQLTGALAVGCQGAIDGLAGFFPKTVVRLYALATQARAAGETAEEAQAREKEVRRLQYIVSAAEELVVKHGTVGIKEGVARVLGMGAREQGGERGVLSRAPMGAGLEGGEAEWDKWRGVMGDVWGVEEKL